jgi:hypothetical protein
MSYKLTTNATPRTRRVRNNRCSMLLVQTAFIGEISLISPDFLQLFTVSAEYFPELRVEATRMSMLIRVFTLLGTERKTG